MKTLERKPRQSWEVGVETAGRKCGLTIEQTWDEWNRENIGQLGKPHPVTAGTIAVLDRMKVKGFVDPKHKYVLKEDATPNPNRMVVGSETVRRWYIKLELFGRKEIVVVDPYKGRRLM